MVSIIGKRVKIVQQLLGDATDKNTGAFVGMEGTVVFHDPITRQVDVRFDTITDVMQNIKVDSSQSFAFMEEECEILN